MAHQAAQLRRELLRRGGRGQALRLCARSSSRRFNRSAHSAAPAHLASLALLRTGLFGSLSHDYMGCYRKAHAGLAPRSGRCLPATNFTRLFSPAIHRCTMNHAPSAKHTGTVKRCSKPSFPNLFPPYAAMPYRYALCPRYVRCPNHA